MLRRMWGKGGTHLFLVSVQTGAAALEVSVENSKTARKNLQCDPAILLLGICPKDLTSYSIDTCSVLLIAAVFTMREVKPTTCPSTDK